MKKAFARLGAPTPDDVELSWEDICIENEKWTERFKEIAAEEGVYELNRLAVTVNSADMDLEKLWAVAEYGKAEDAKQLSRLAENLDCFTFIMGASNYEEVGIYVTENNEDFSVNPSVEKSSSITKPLENISALLTTANLSTAASFITTPTQACSTSYIRKSL